MRKIPLAILFIAWAIAGCRQTAPDKLTIATAANMQFAMKELTRAFTHESGLACEAIISSSGKHTAQIKEGAPFDLFVSANMKYPNELYSSGLTTGPPEVYAHGKLVLWSMKDRLIPSVKILPSDQFTHIALANPKTAPYGMAAIEVLKHHGIYEQVADRLVYGESIAQTNQFITSQAAEAGFTAMSVVLSPDIKGQGNWVEIDTSIYTPISQGIVILKKTDQPEAARLFFDFLFSEMGKEILKKFGYSISNK